MRDHCRPPLRTLLFCLLVQLAPSALAIEAGMPNPPSTPTTVTVGVFLADIISLDEMEETFQAELIILAEWEDPRLAFDAEAHGNKRKLFQGQFQFNEVFAGWWPSFLILNEIGSGDVKGLQIEVFSDGRVHYKEQRNVTLETPMKLRKFPFDKQVLEAHLISFGDSSNEVLLEVDKRVLGASEEYATVNENVNIAQWRLVALDLIPIASSNRYYAEEEWVSEVMLTITMQRQPSHMFWKVIVPMVILVSLMWAVFWMDIHDLADRLNICFIGILTIVAYQFLIDGDMPHISYFTFTDSIVLFSFIVMCLTILESLIVVSLSNGDKDAMARRVDTIAKWLFPAVYFFGLLAIYLFYKFAITD